MARGSGELHHSALNVKGRVDLFLVQSPARMRLMGDLILMLPIDPIVERRLGDADSVDMITSFA